MSHNSAKSLKSAPEMDDQEEIIPNLPPEIILNILSRIPIETVFTCKCVCKSWLELLESPEFARSHLSNSVPGLLIYHFGDKNDTETGTFKIFRFEDSLEVERHELHYKRVLELKSENVFGDSTPLVTDIDGSANGLLFIRNTFPKRTDYYICNPITHERLKLPEPEAVRGRGTIISRGFGTSRLTNQYKVVMIFHYLVRDPVTGLSKIIPEIDCLVYTLGTGSWRSVTAPRETLLDCFTGKLLNGNLYWLTVDATPTVWVSRFDIETEVFSKFRAPALGLKGPPIEVGVLRDRLCVSEFLKSTNEIIIYLMTDDGYEKESWNKEYVISNTHVVPGGHIDTICPLKAFGDGDLLLALDHVCLFCYPSRTKTMALVETLNEDVQRYSEAILYTPSFIPLKDFETEDAKLFEFACSVIS